MYIDDLTRSFWGYYRIERSLSSCLPSLIREYVSMQWQAPIEVEALAEVVLSSGHEKQVFIFVTLLKVPAIVSGRLGAWNVGKFQKQKKKPQINSVASSSHHITPIQHSVNPHPPPHPNQHHHYYQNQHNHHLFHNHHHYHHRHHHHHPHLPDRVHSRLVRLQNSQLSRHTRYQEPHCWAWGLGMALQWRWSGGKSIIG